MSTQEKKNIPSTGGRRIHFDSMLNQKLFPLNYCLHFFSFAR
jgi:hypothetical protein